jgi:hypothetical protein
MSMVEVEVGGGSERSVGGIVTPEAFLILCEGSISALQRTRSRGRRAGIDVWSGTSGDARSPGVVGRFGHAGFLVMRGALR